MDLEVEKLLRKGAIEEVEPCENQFLSNIFTIPKKGGERRPVVDMRDLNNFIEPVHFKMEDLSHLPSLLRRGDFMCKIDLKDAYQTIPIAKKSRIYLRFLWRGRLYQFTCLPFGLRSSPRIFTKVLKPLLVYLRALGVRLLVYLDDILIMAATPELSGAHAADMAVVDRFRFSGKPKEVSFSTQTTSRIPGVHCKFHRNEIVFNGRKTVKSKTRSREAAEIKPSGKDIGKLLGLLPVNSSSHCSGSSPFQKFTGRYDKGLKRLKGGTRVPECSLSLSGGQERTGMVEGLRKNEQWQKHFAPRRTRHNILRRFQARMGGTSESSKNRGSMELGGKVKITHKLARVKSSFPGFASFSSPTKTSACSDWHRQQNSNDLYQQIRGNPFTSSHISSLRDLELCSRQKPDFVSSVCSRRGKPDCRQKVKGVPGQPGMDAAFSSVSGITKRSWLFQYRSLCNTGEPSGSCICQLETRAWGSCHRCFQCKMGFSTGLPIPSLLYDQKVPQKNSARSGTLCPDHTSVEKQPLVSSHSISVSRATIASAKTAGSSETSRHRKDTPPVPSKKLQAGCMAHFRAKLAKEGFSQKVSDILLSSWRKKTASQYESAWKAWSGWCSEREINPFSTTLEIIFEFLADLFHKGFKFRTLGVYRSAISSNHETVDGFVIGKHPMMGKFMKGVFSLRPPEPKYFVTWDVRQVLDFLKTWSPVESLSLKQLTLKLVMLAALIAAARSSSVNKMNLCFRYFKPHGVLFKVPGLTKCAGPKRPLQNLFLASFPPDRRLCFVNYLKQYEKVTKNLRQKTENTQNLLFISYVKPHKPVTSATIARWVKTVLSLAGIDGVFTAHSTRGASASAAARAGVALSDIMEAADWSRESTFKKILPQTHSEECVYYGCFKRSGFLRLRGIRY